MEETDNKKIKVLLIEDNPDDVAYIQELLSREHSRNYIFEYSEYLKDGIDNLNKKQFDVVLLDLSLPDSKGLQTVEKLITLFPDVPIVVLTGLKDDRLGIESIKTGAQDYQVKGIIDTTSLINSILYAIERHSLLVKSRFSNRFLKANLSYFEHLINFSHRINKKLDLVSIFRVLKEKVTSLCFCRLFSLFLLAKDLNQLRLVSHNHPEWQQLLDPYYVEKDNGLMWHAIRGRKLLKVENFSASVFKKTDRERYEDDIAICVPLVLDNTTIGVLNLNAPVISAFTDELMAKLETVSLQLSMAINNALLHKQIEELSITDSLTGLFNRRHLSLQLMNEMKRLTSYPAPLSLLMIDIDSFKLVNDSCGHLAGDHVLREIASIIKNSIRKVDIPGRYGGEEFIVILPNADGRQAVQTAETIRQAVAGRQMRISEAEAIDVTVSIGVAEYNSHIADARMLIKTADKALYNAKHRGKNLVVCYAGLQEQEENPDYIVRIYFIEPFPVISGVIDTLIRMEFESYAVPGTDKWKLPKIMDENIRNILFICIEDQTKVKEWLYFIHEMQKHPRLDIRIGAFIYNKMNRETRLLFLERNISTIQVSAITENTVDLIEKILTCYEARGKRKHIRARAAVQSRAFFAVSFQEIPAKGEIINLSIYSFACRLAAHYLDYFKVGNYFDDVLLILKGVQVRISARVLGFDKDDHQVCYLQIYNKGEQEQNLHSSGSLTTDVKEKLYSHLSLCLSQDLREQLAQVE